MNVPLLAAVLLLSMPILVIGIILCTLYLNSTKNPTRYYPRHPADEHFYDEESK